MGWSRVLVLTFKPAVEQAWRDDLEHKDFAGWRFRGKDDEQPDLADTNPLIWFASFQDVLGRGDDGEAKIKNRDLFNVEWDAVVVRPHVRRHLRAPAVARAADAPTTAL